MPTIVNRQIIAEIIANDGYYPGDPQVTRIVQYNNQFNGELAWGVTYEHDDPNKYLNAPACHNPRIIFDVQRNNDEGNLSSM
jgi:hypothetical protein